MLAFSNSKMILNKLGSLSEKKQDYVGKILKNLRKIFGLHQKITILAPEKTIALGIGDRPPLLGKFPTYSRFSSRQVACKIGWEPFWHAKNNLVNRHQEVGLGQTPPPVWEFFPHNPVFF